MHILRSGARSIRDQALTLVSHMPRRQFATIVAGELDDYSKRRLAMSKAHWVQMSLPADLHPLRQIDTAKRLARLLQDQQTDVVHAHGFQAAFTALYARRHLRRKPAVICTPYGLPGLDDRPALQRRWVATAARWVVREADMVIVHSEHESLQLQTLAPDPLHNLRIVPEGVALESLREDFEPGAKRRLVGLDPGAAVVGVMAPPGARGIRCFLEAAQTVMARTPNVDFVSIGEDAKTEEFAGIAHNLGLSGCMVFLGERADVVEVIASLNVLVIPADYPGARYHAVHALANGIPLVVAAEGGLPEVVSDVKQARTVPPDSPAALVDALSDFIDAVPQAGDDNLYDDELGFSYRDLLVAGTVIDLDSRGLDPVAGKQLDEQQAAVQRTIQRHSMRRMAAQFADFYAQLADRCVTGIRRES